MKCLLPGDPRRRGAIACAVTAGLVLAALSLTGCPGSLEPGVTGGAMGGMTGGASCEVALLANRCALSGCHAAAINSAGLDLESPGVAARLVDHDTSTDTSAQATCMGKKLLDAHSNPATGVFVEKITTPTCGSKMPYGGSLTTTEIKCLTDWATSLTSTTAFTGGVSP